MYYRYYNISIILTPTYLKYMVPARGLMKVACSNVTEAPPITSSMERIVPHTKLEPSAALWMTTERPMMENWPSKKRVPVLSTADS